MENRMTLERNFNLYAAALAADETFSKELIRVYGPKNACEKRYQLAPHFDSAVESARIAKQQADAIWLNEMQRTPL
jgi:hypothetical protein